jgi:hypothetical protein
VRCNGRKKSYQTLIESNDKRLHIYLGFTLSINFKSYNLFYDGHMVCAVYLTSAECVYF